MVSVEVRIVHIGRVFGDVILRAGIITYVSRRDELHVIKNLATLGERRLSGRLPCRRLKHRVREEKTVLQPDAGCELAGSHRFVLLAAGCRLGAS